MDDWCVLSPRHSVFVTCTESPHAATELGENCRSLVIRDQRTDKLTPKGIEAIADLEAANGCYVEIDQDEYSLIVGVFDTILAVEERNISIEDVIVDKAMLADYLCTEGVLNKSKVFGHLGIDEFRPPLRPSEHWAPRQICSIDRRARQSR